MRQPAGFLCCSALRQGGDGNSGHCILRNAGSDRTQRTPAEEPGHFYEISCQGRGEFSFTSEVREF